MARPLRIVGAGFAGAGSGARSGPSKGIRMKSKVPLIIGLALFAVVGVVFLLGTDGFMGTDTSSLDVADPSEAQMYEIAQLLLDEDAAIQKRADEKLFKLGEKAVPALKQFATTGYAQSHKAMSLINDISPDEIFALGEQLLENEKLSVRAQAVTFMQIRKTDPRATELWVKALDNSESDVRSEACHLLGNVPRGHRAMAIAGLQKLRTDPDAHVRENAAQALRTLTGKDHKAQFNVE